MNLLSTSALIYSEYWNSISKYNSLFIRLRFWAVLFLASFVIVVSNLFELTQFQFYSAIGITVFILIYNLFFRSYHNKILGLQNIIHVKFSLVQIIADLVSLSFLVYITGGIETPVFMFYIFHMIIGAIILPPVLIYSIAGILIFVISVLSFLEFNEIIPHQGIDGLYSFTFYSEMNFIIAYTIFFSAVILISIYLTQKIAFDLFNRERQLKAALDEVEKAEESKQKYIIAVVHELKSPIAAAASFLDIILGGYLGDINDAVKDKLNKTKTRVEESINNINSILRVSKYKLLNNVEMETIDINEIINENIQNIISVADKNSIEIIYSDNSAEKNYISGDKVLLKLVFSNLIGNAVKYTPPKGKVEIAVSQLDGKSKIIISDSGIGIPVKEQDKVFEEFYRATNTSGKKIEGTGTGLSVVKQIVESHNGEITIESPAKSGTKQNPGTTFTVTLPSTKM
ncbi:MAG: HAMP domain-containing histidine kinase [Ignavibacteriae bacterium]|nr:sensor histidine kinase [Ignavibacteriota bacterium]NOG96533.1 HAMP domain-containing histidine kinase [Ignavibacteriota bacterium]